YLKLRGSFADIKSGNTSGTIGPSYAALNQSTPLGYGSAYYSSYGGPNYFNQNTFNISKLYGTTTAADLSPTLANPNIKQFEVSSTEFGGDIRFLNNKIGIGVTYYTTTNGPGGFADQVAASTGFNASVIGLTTSKNGYELQVTLNPFTNTNGWSWELDANYATYTEKLKSVTTNTTSVLLNNHYYHIGDRLDAIYGFKYYRDPSGNVIINENNASPLQPSSSNVNAEQVLGYANPDFIWGIHNKVSFKNWSFSFQFDGRQGGSIYDEIWVDQFQSGNSTDLTTGAMGAARYAEWQDAKASG